MPNTPPLSRHSPSTFPLAHLETAFDIKILEPTYVEHAQAHLLGQSALDPRKGRDDKKWNAVSKKEKQRRTDTAVSLARASEVGECLLLVFTYVDVANSTLLLSDLRTFRTFYSLVQRLLEPDLASSPQVCLIFPPPNVRPKSDSLLSTPYFRLLALLRPLDRIDSLCQRG